MLLVSASALGFSVMHALIRFLTDDLHPFEVAFFRNFFGLVALAPLLLRQGAKALHTSSPGMHVVRSLLQTGSMLLFFTALSMSALAKVSALGFTAPLFASLGAILFLRERVRLQRALALGVGVLGALVVVNPGASIDTGVVLVLISSATWGVALILIKQMSKRDSAVTLAFYMSALMAPMSLVPALFVWRWPSTLDLGLLFLMGGVGVASHIALAQALREADATVVLPFDFTRLIWASALGYLLFSEVPGYHTWIGGLLIFASTSFIAYREQRLRPG